MMKIDKLPYSPCRRKGNLNGSPAAVPGGGQLLWFPDWTPHAAVQEWGGRRDSSVPRPDAGVSFSGCGHKDLGYCNPDSTRQSTMERISCLIVQAMNFHSGPRPTAHTTQAYVFLRVIWCHAAPPPTQVHDKSELTGLWLEDGGLSRGIPTFDKLAGKIPSLLVTHWPSATG